MTFCERRIEPIAVQRTLAAPIEMADSRGRERTGVTPIEHADRLVGLACQRDNHVAVRSAVSIGIAAGSILRPLVVKIVAVYDIVVGNQIIRVSTDLCCGKVGESGTGVVAEVAHDDLDTFCLERRDVLGGICEDCGVVRVVVVVTLPDASPRMLDAKRMTCVKNGVPSDRRYSPALSGLTSFTST